MSENRDDVTDLFGDSDDEQEVQPQQVPTEEVAVKDEVEDLFGSEDEEEQKPKVSSRNYADEAEEGHSEDEADEEAEAEAEEVVSGEYVVKKLASRAAFARGSPKKVTFQPIEKVKESESLELFSLPNVVAIDDVEYNAKDGAKRVEEFKNTLSETRARVTEGYRNVIRWRKRINADGTEKLESNARLIEWPDGLVELQVGNELFTVSSSATEPTHPSYLYAQQRDGPMQPVGTFHKRTKFSLRDIKSSAHRALKGVVAAQMREKMRATTVSHELTDTRALLQEQSQASRAAESQKLKAYHADADDQRGERGYGFGRGYEDDEEGLRYAGDDYDDIRPKKEKKEKKEKKSKKEKKEKKEKKRSREESASDMDDFIVTDEEY